MASTSLSPVEAIAASAAPKEGMFRPGMPSIAGPWMPSARPLRASAPPAAVTAPAMPGMPDWMLPRLFWKPATPTEPSVGMLGTPVKYDRPKVRLLVTSRLSTTASMNTCRRSLSRRSITPFSAA